MFCSNCGTKLRDGVKFCSNCGNAVGSNNSQQINRTISPSPNTQMVAAKCTNCGSALIVDSNLKKAICPYCKFTYIVDQAINNYNISVSSGVFHVGNATINMVGADTQNLIKRAEEFLSRGRCKEAVEYYEKVLDLDYDNEVAKSRIEAIKNYTFYSDNNMMIGFSSPLVELKYGKIVVNKKIVLLGTTKLEYHIQHFAFRQKGLLSEDEIWYGGNKLDWSNIGFWKRLIIEAKKGIYPIMTIGPTLGEDYKAEKSAIFNNTKGDTNERLKLLQELGKKYGVFDSNYNIQSELSNGEEGYFLLLTLAYLEIYNAYKEVSGLTMFGGWKTILDKKDFILAVLNKYHLVKGNEDNLELIEKLRNSKYNNILNTRPQGSEIKDLVSSLPDSLAKAKKKYGVK